MIPGMNPRKMQQMMRRMGIHQVDIPATEVIIKTEDKDFVITEPQVSKVNMMGQETFQITGQVHAIEKSTEPEINEDDIKTVMEQTNVNRETATKAIEETKGDLAKAIMNLQQQNSTNM
jgi:nascent polypeptide-associated complex subunit alpha